MTRDRIRLACTLLLAGFSLTARAELIGVSLDAPTAREVYVSGSFDPFWQKSHPMKKDATGRWILVLDRPPGRYEFQFLVDGQWRHDLSRPKVADALGGWNNVLVVIPRNER